MRRPINLWVFSVVSTWEEDWTTEDGRICRYADVWNASHRDRMVIAMRKPLHICPPVIASMPLTTVTLHDTITITVSPEYHVLVTTGSSASEYAPYRGIINEGIYHRFLKLGFCSHCPVSLSPFCILRHNDNGSCDICGMQKCIVPGE